MCTVYILKFKDFVSLFQSFLFVILLDSWELLDTFWVGKSQSQVILYVVVETYLYYINRFSTKFLLTQCQTMIQLHFFFLGGEVTTFEAFALYFCFACIIITVLNLVIVYVVAVFDSGKTFEYYYYLLKLCKNAVMYQELLVTFLFSVVTRSLLKTYLIGIQ